MLPQKFTYANVGVDRKLRAKSKKALHLLKKPIVLALTAKLFSFPMEIFFQ